MKLVNLFLCFMPENLVSHINMVVLIYIYKGEHFTRKMLTFILFLLFILTLSKFILTLLKFILTLSKFILTFSEFNLDALAYSLCLLKVLF